jgi:uncharacterized surface protein with fasciclin (FAS1) repeats
MVNESRRNVLKAVGGAGALLSLGSVSVASAKRGRGRGRRRGAGGDTTIVDLAVENGFDVLAAAVTEVGLVDTLSGRRQLTVFAPPDAAFNAAGITVDNVDAVPTDFLVDVLTYHVVPGRRYASSVVNVSSIPTLNGAKIAVDGTVLNDGQADIVATDFEASNGVVHAIDGVLLP